jgi:hypothetical protein
MDSVYRLTSFRNQSWKWTLDGSGINPSAVVSIPRSMPKSGRRVTQLRHTAFDCHVFAVTMEEVRLHKASDDSQTLGFLFRVPPHPP